MRGTVEERSRNGPLRQPPSEMEVVTDLSCSGDPLLVVLLGLRHPAPEPHRVAHRLAGRPARCQRPRCFGRHRFETEPQCRVVVSPRPGGMADQTKGQMTQRMAVRRRAGVLALRPGRDLVVEAQDRVVGQLGQQLERQVGVIGKGPPMRGAQVAELLTDAVATHPFRGTVQTWRRFPYESERPFGMAAGGVECLARFGEPFGAVFPQRLQHPVAVVLTMLFGDHQRLAHQLVE